MTHSTSPAFRMVAATLSDDENEAYPCRGIWVGVAGNVKITCMDDTAIVLPNVVAGMLHGINAKRVWENGTTATGIFLAY